jgi:hypothetical protein
LVPDTALAQGPPDPAAFALAPASRVRCLDREACRLLAAGITASPTIAREVADLQVTDLIVGVETSAVLMKIRGEARMLAATPGARHVRIRIRIPGAWPELLSVLGHELQHALEIAAAPDVRDTATFRAHYLRIGYERMHGGYYETEAAIEAGRRVAAELAAPPEVAGPVVTGRLNQKEKR